MAAKQSKFLIGALLIVSAVGYLIYTSIQETKVYYFTIDEFLLNEATLTNTDVRVAGRVQDGSIQWDPAALNLTFKLTPIEPGTMPVGAIPTGVAVSYQGILPDMFAEGSRRDCRGPVYTGPATRGIDDHDELSLKV